MNIHMKEKELIQQVKNDAMKTAVKEMVTWESKVKGTCIIFMLILKLIIKLFSNID